VSDWIEIKAKTKTGVTQTFQVSEILEIDGKPYQSAEQTQDLREHVIHLDGRVSAIEKFISKE
jgi:hypothetical protein